MPAPNVCTVSGTVYGPDGVAVANAKIDVYVTTAFTDAFGNYIAQGLAASTVTDSSGAWSLNVIRTENLNTSVTFQFRYPISEQQALVLYYPAVIPEQSTANFTDLVDLSNSTSVIVGITTTDQLPEGSVNLYGSSMLKSNQVSLSNNASSAAVTFATAWATGTQYGLFFTIKNIVDGSVVAASFAIMAQSETGFTVQFSPVDSSNYILKWAAVIRHDV